MAGHNPLVAEATARDSIRDGGIWKEKELDLFSGKTAGLTLTGATNPIVATPSGHQEVIRWAAADVADLTYNFFPLPGDYDETSDAFKLLMLVRLSTAGESMTINAAILLGRAAVAQAAAVISTGAATIANNTDKQLIVIDFDKKNYTTAKTTNFKGRDSLQIDITPGTHGTAVLDLYGVGFLYRGGLSLFTESTRYAA